MTALAAKSLEVSTVEPAEVREAVHADNEQLVSLTSACPMRGDLTLRMDRGPDFFALHRLEGERSQLGVVERAGKVVG